MSRSKKQTQAVDIEQKNATTTEPPEEHTAPPEELNESQSSDATAADEQTEGETPAETNAEQEEKPAEAETPSEVEKAVDNGGVIDPIAFEITLKSHHPQATYGRCGYRFNKAEPLEIARADLTDAQIIMLAEDPWLEFVPVVEA